MERNTPPDIPLARGYLDHLVHNTDRIAAARGWRRAMVAGSAGALSTLAFAPFQFWPILLLTLPVLVWSIDGAAARHHGSVAERGWRKHSIVQAALSGWWFGYGFFVAGLYWIGYAFLVEAETFLWLLPFAVSLLPAGLALFFAAATAVAARFWTVGWQRIIVLALALTASEWLRGHILTGFPWNVLGYALTGSLPMMQSASVLGVYGLTFWTVVVGTAPLALLADHAATRLRLDFATAIRVLSPLVIVVVQLGFGHWRLQSPPPQPIDGVKLRIVQPSIPQREKWRPENQRSIFLQHLALSRQRPDGSSEDTPSVSHVIWPEAAMPFRPLDSPEALRLIGETLGPRALLLAGALREEPASAASPRRVYNSLIVFDGAGRAHGVHDKNHLVPFGEYLPFQATLESVGLEALTRMRGGFAAGPRPRPLLHVVGLGPTAALVCYEAIFPGSVIQGRERPSILVNVTNDGWFGPSTGPRQHAHMARVRAVEEGVMLARAANNGLSALVDPYGRIVASLELDARGVIEGPALAPIPAPAYARSGDLWAVLQSLLALILVALGRRAR
jgi:apolipoprotein N-acyltransferase